MRDEAIELFHAQSYSAALALFLRLYEEGENDHNLFYLIGQCYRYLDQYSQATYYLEIASNMNPSAPYLLSLGIALQLDKEYDQAIEVFENAIKTDKNYLLPYNSLALTYKRKGEYQKAADIYENVLKIMGYQIIFDMKNYRETVFIASNFFENNLWFEYAITAAIYFSQADDIGSIRFPTEESAEKEEREHNYEGLYWIDEEDDEGKISRLFLPNYFNTYQMILASDSIYASFMGDRGQILKLLGENEDAQKHLIEADEFMQLYNRSR